MTNTLPGWHANTRAALVNPSIASAAVAACMGQPGSELALIINTEADRIGALPASCRLGYAVDAKSGEVFRPGTTLPRNAELYVSVRVPLSSEHDGAAAIDTMSALVADGWRLECGPRLVPALDRSLAVIRGRAQDLRPACDEHTDAVPSTVDGTGVLLGVVDFGCDFAHPSFRDSFGHTRLRFLWDQNDPGSATVPGTFHEREQIEAALAAPDPYQALGYWPDRQCYAPALSRRTNLVHGTHVLGVAAGTQIEGCPPGVAPGAELAFVHLRPGALVAHGDPADVFDGVCAIFDRASQLGMPAVVNLSLGANTGSHDGNTLYDCALDALMARPGRAIAVSAGNERQARLNVDGEVSQGKQSTLIWRFGTGDSTPNTLRIFSEATDGWPRLSCTVSRNGVAVATNDDGNLNGRWFAAAAGMPGVLYSGLAPTRGDQPLQHIEIRVQPSGADERLEVSLSTLSDVPVPFDAWIDRDDQATASQSYFEMEQPITRSTLSCTACGRRTLTVGAFKHRLDDLEPAEFSAEGLTRDMRHKPDVSAPGFDVLAPAAYGGRIPPGGTWRNPLSTRMSGTSAAAPHVAGLQALLLQLKPDLTAEAGADIIRATAKRDPATEANGWHTQIGYGRIDAAAAVERLRA